jgi:hypothetical protein
MKYPEIASVTFAPVSYRSKITAAISSKDITKNMVRVRSSNMWSYAMNVKDPKMQYGDLYIQFKGALGGPDDIYVYYDVPTALYRRLVAAPSKGHFFHQYIRNNFIYAKLTGDKKTKLKNGI